jgi:hypothetical protein
MIHDVEQIRGRDVIFLASFLNHSELLAQVILLVLASHLTCYKDLRAILIASLLGQINDYRITLLSYWNNGKS